MPATDIAATGIATAGGLIPGCSTRGGEVGPIAVGGAAITRLPASPALAPRPIVQSLRPRQAGFSLMEILVVVGILVVLAAILVPTISAVRKQAARAATRFTINTVAVGLDAYKQDMGSYPAVRWNIGDANSAVAGTHPRKAHNPPSGSQVLAWALVGFADSGAADAELGGDGADGPGIRKLGTTGRVYGPYIQLDRFKLVDLRSFLSSPPTGSDVPTPDNWRSIGLADENGIPIIYLAAGSPRPRRFDELSGASGTQYGTYIAFPSGSPSTNDTDPRDHPNTLWDPRDAVFTRGAATLHLLTINRSGMTSAEANRQLAMMLGDFDTHNASGAVTSANSPDGRLGPGEVGLVGSEYFLAMAGEDEMFGTEENTPTRAKAIKTDDVSNLDP